MTIWHWVRHGPTHEAAFTGWRDVPADLGDRTALSRLDRALPRDALLIASDLRRASATADAIGRGRSRLPDDPALREFDFGAWDGLTFDAVTARDPVLSRAYWDAPGDICAPGGESWNMAAARVAPLVDRLTAAHPDAEIVAVAHFGIILSQLAMAAGDTPSEVLGHRIDNLSVTRLIHADGHWQVGAINHVA